MELSKKVLTKEQIDFLKTVSPKLATLLGTAESKELKAEEIFKSDKKGKSAKEKFYIFIGLLFFDRQPIVMKKDFSWKVRTNIASKEQVEAILTEGGIKDTKAIFERAKKYYEDKEKGATAPKAPPVQKGKPDGNQHFRGARSHRGRYHGEGPPDYGNNFFPYEENAEPDLDKLYEEWKRANPKAAEKTAEKLRRNQAERNKWHAEFKRKEEAAWKRQFPGTPYTSQATYGWIFNEQKNTWEKVDFSARPPPNPFWDDEYMFGRSGTQTRAPPPPPRAEPARPVKQVVPCSELLRQKGILVAGDSPRDTKKKFLKWAIENHPDKGGDTTIFQEVSDCFDKEIKPHLGGAVNKTRRRRKN